MLLTRVKKTACDLYSIWVEAKQGMSWRGLLVFPHREETSQGIHTEQRGCCCTATCCPVSLASISPVCRGNMGQDKQDGEKPEFQLPAQWRMIHPSTLMSAPICAVLIFISWIFHSRSNDSTSPINLAGGSLLRSRELGALTCIG